MTWFHVKSKKYILLRRALHYIVVVARITKSVVTGQAPVTLKLEEYPREKHKQTKQKWHTHIIPQLTQFMPPTTRNI